MCEADWSKREAKSYSSSSKWHRVIELSHDSYAVDEITDEKREAQSLRLAW